MTMADIQVLLGVSKRTLQVWRATGRLPEPDFAVENTLRWSRSTIQEWIDRRGVVDSQR
ncbi:MAG: helix-turn-helix domain-containing protein [Dehalococcoidia bacterium]|nr:helix-turn-helix domain-containing protein [Dehalococcoidia bacterium]